MGAPHDPGALAIDYGTAFHPPQPRSAGEGEMVEDGDLDLLEIGRDPPTDRGPPVRLTRT